MEGIRPRGAGIAIVLVALLAIPAGLPAEAAGPAKADIVWPPAAWDDGRIDDLPLLEQVLLSTGLRPGTPAAHDVEAQLAELENMDPTYSTLVHQSVSAYAKALWHQERALDGLTEKQLYI